MSFLTRLLLVTLLSGPCIPQDQKEYIILTLKNIDARQDSLLQKFDDAEDKLLAQHEQLENLKLSVSRCSTEHQISTFQDLLATDVDECKDDSNVCGDGEICINLPGNYTCICKDGYEKHGDICQDVNECRQPHICPEDQKCANLPGSYKCFVCTLPRLELQPLGCIALAKESMTWSDAQAKCNEEGGSLLYGFTKHQLTTIYYHFNWGLSAWVGIQGGFFVKSPSDDGLLGGNSSSPAAHLWYRYDEPDGRLGDDTQCGLVDLHATDPSLWDEVCSATELPYLCQILYY